MAGKKVNKIVKKECGSSKQDAPKKSNRRSKCVVEDACKFCKETSLREDDQMVICEHCEDFICISCAKLSSEEYSFLQKTESFHWFCSDCEKPTLRARKSEKQMEENWFALFAAFRAEMENNYRKEMNTLSNLVGSLSNELSSLRKELIEERAQRKNTENLEKMELKNHNVDIAEIASESSRELLDRERRKCNLVWFGIPESTASETNERVMADNKYVADCCSKALSTPVDIASCKRLRSKNDATNACRPLLVTVKDPAQVWSVLKAAKKLGETVEFKSVFVKKDSTPLERAEFRKKWQERNRRRNAENHVNTIQDLTRTPTARRQSREMEDN